MKRSDNSCCILVIVFIWGCFLIPETGFCQKKISIIFHHLAGKEELVLGNNYTNPFGENILIRKFRYYVSNFSITDQKGNKIPLPVEYFLVDEADSSSKIISLTIPETGIRSIHFLLGVDSIRNVSGIQTGMLDPMKGMFWTWNTGYIMAKLEGSSESSHIAGHSFTYHIGGYKDEMNTVKKIDLTLPQKEEPVHEIHISADIYQWFKNKYEIRISETPFCHTPGPLAMKMADNYSNMFSINAIR